MQKYKLHTGEEKSLEDILSQSERTLLYFYPKDMTPGCTIQARWYRDLYQRFLDKGIQIIGVSRDDEKKHQRFIEKFELPFPLIADTESILCEKFDVLKEKSMFGKKYMGIVRSTFLLDKEGNILEEWRNINLREHFKLLEETLL